MKKQKNKTEIHIIADANDANSKFIVIKAISKKDCFLQIDKLIENKTITKNWELFGSYSLGHRWFNN